MTKQHSLLLSTPMVLSTLRGEKTETRRTPSCTNSLVDGKRISGKAWKAHNWDWLTYTVHNNTFMVWSNKVSQWCYISPIYNQGDTIWFKETFRVNSWVPDDGEICFRYEADGALSGHIGIDDEDAFNKYWVQSCEDLADAGYEIDENENYSDYDYKALRLRPSIHMPKAAARLWATVSAPCTCERLQDITEEQAKREGVDWILDKDFNQAFKNYSPGCDTYEFESAVESFKTLWASINGWDSYAANPPVYVIPFNLIDIPEVVKGDTMTQ